MYDLRPAIRHEHASKTMRICGVKEMISPEVRQSFLLSSKTVFMDSIHSASTGPSKITQWLSGQPLLPLATAVRTHSLAMPSDHSRVTSSKAP